MSDSARLLPRIPSCRAQGQHFLYLTLNFYFVRFDTVTAVTVKMTLLRWDTFLPYSVASSRALVLRSTEVMVKWGTGGNAPDIFYLNIGWRWVISFSPGPFYPHEQLNMSLTGVRRPALNGWTPRLFLFNLCILLPDLPLSWVLLPIDMSIFSQIWP